MTGAIVPDDWDGETLECMRIEWPASEKWRAILLGQVSEPAKESYWDATTGDQEEAAVGVDTAYRLTEQNIDSVGCDDMIPGIPVPTFKVNKDTTLGLAATTWTIVPWDLYEYEHNDPDFVLGSSAHAVRDEALFGLWHYEVILRTTNFYPIFIRADITPGPTTLAWVGGSGRPINLSFDHVWGDTSDLLTIWVHSDTADNLALFPNSCHWSGTFLGPVEDL